MDSILPKVIKDVFLKSRPMILHRGRAFQVERTAGAKTMRLGFAWCFMEQKSDIAARAEEKEEMRLEKLWSIMNALLVR